MSDPPKCRIRWKPGEKKAAVDKLRADGFERGKNCPHQHGNGRCDIVLFERVCRGGRWRMVPKDPPCLAAEKVPKSEIFPEGLRCRRQKVLI